MQRLGGHLAGFLRTLLQDTVNLGDVLFELVATLADGFQAVVQHLHQELLALHVAQSAPAVVVLHLVQVLIVGPEIGKVVVGSEGIQIGEHHVAFHVSGVFHLQVGRVGIGRLHLFLHLFLRVAQVDAVAQALAHLRIAVGSRQTQAHLIGGQHNLRLHKHWSINLIEAAHDFAALLQHRLLVLACRHSGGLAERDVGSLRNGIGEEAHGHALAEVAHLQFRLHRRIALQASHVHQIHIVDSQFRQFRNHRLYEHRHLRGVESHRQIVESHLNNILAHLLGIVSIISQCLYVGNKHEHFVIVAFVLQFHASAQRPHIMSQMKASGRAVARKYNSTHIFV